MNESPPPVPWMTAYIFSYGCDFVEKVDIEIRYVGHRDVWHIDTDTDTDVWHWHCAVWSTSTSRLEKTIAYAKVAFRHKWTGFRKKLGGKKSRDTSSWTSTLNTFYLDTFESFKKKPKDQKAPDAANGNVVFSCEI